MHSKPNNAVNSDAFSFALLTTNAPVTADIIRLRNLCHMNQDELKAVFDKQATGYEEQQKKLAPVHDGLYFQL